MRRSSVFAACRDKAFLGLDLRARCRKCKRVQTEAAVPVGRLGGVRDACLAGRAGIPGRAARAREPQRRSAVVAAGADALAGPGDPPPRHVHRHPPAAAPNQQVVGAGEGIYTVVVRPVRKSGQLVEQLPAVPAADELCCLIRRESCSDGPIPWPKRSKQTTCKMGCFSKTLCSSRTKSTGS